MKIKPTKLTEDFPDIVQRDPVTAAVPLSKNLVPGVYWAKVAGASTWEFVVITKGGYVQELTGARRTVPIERVPGEVSGLLFQMPE